MNKKYLTGISLVRIDSSLLSAIYKAPNNILKIKDKDPRNWNYWTVRQIYAPASKHVDRLIWEKHIFQFNPEIWDWEDTIAPNPRVVYIDNTAAVLLHQGKKSKCIPYLPGLRMAMDEAKVHCFYTKTPEYIYSDVPTRVEAYISGFNKPLIVTALPPRAGKPTRAYRIPLGVDLVVQTRYEPNGDVTRILFGDSYVRVKHHLETIVGREVEDFQNTWRDHIESIDDLIL